MSKNRIERVAIKASAVDLDFSAENGIKRDEFTMHSNDVPLPSFPAALAALKPHVLEMLGLDEEYGETLFILSASIKYKGSDNRMGASISCQKNLSDGKRPLVFSTPYRSVAKEVSKQKKGKKADTAVPMDILTAECVCAIEFLQKEALAYLDGKRAQMELNLGKTGEEPAKNTVQEKEESNLIEEAKAIILETQRASTAMLQKRLELSFKEAALLMDKLEEEGMIGPATGSGNARKILVAA